MARRAKMNWTASVGQYTTTINGRFHRLGADKEEAQRQFDFLSGKADEGGTGSANPTLAEVAEAWLEEVQKSCSPARYRQCRDRMSAFINHAGKLIRARDLRARHVEGWLSANPDISTDGTRAHYRAIVLACLNWAASAKVQRIASNPLRGKLELPLGEARGGEAVWAPEVFKLVLDNVHPRFADLLHALAWTGARPSTVRHVEARHYLPHLRVWHVEDLYSQRRHKQKYVKRVWLNPQCVELVERLNQEQPAGPIFRNACGRPYTDNCVTTTMVKLRQRLSRRVPPVLLPEGLCVYGLRHTFATQFIVQHPDKLEYLRELLGHRDLKMIRRHYGHLFDETAVLHDVLGSMKTLE